MKKYAILFMSFLLIESMKAQEVIVDSASTKEKDIIILGGNDVSISNEPTCVYSNGTCMNINSGLSGIYCPALGWSIAMCTLSDGSTIKEESLILLHTSPSGYANFDSESRVLIRFTDNSVSTLHRDMKTPVSTNYSSMWMGNTLMKFFKTSIRLKLDTDTRSKIMNPTLGIVKVRVVYTNGNILDYELKPKRQMKYPEELRKSYFEANHSNEKRTQNSDDSTF